MIFKQYQRTDCLLFVKSENLKQFKSIIFLSIALALFTIQLSSCITPRKAPRRMLAEAKENHAPFDAIIVPGIPFNNGAWDSVMKARVLWALCLYNNGITKNVIFSGAAVYSPYHESKIMGVYAQKLGIPAERIFYDTLARHSTENVYYSYKLAKKLGFKKLALATDPFQSLLLRRFLRRRFETTVHRVPFVVDTLRAYKHLNPILEATEYQQFRDKRFFPITETEGLFQRIRGTLGREIEWENIPNGKLEAL